MKYPILILFTLACATHLVATPVIVNAELVSGDEFKAGEGPENLNDGSGLSSNLNTGDAIPGTLPTHGVNSISQQWRVQQPTQSKILTFDLVNDDNTTTAYDITGVFIWNYNESRSGGTEYERGLDEVEILWSDDNRMSWTSLGNFNFDQADGTSTSPGQTINFVSTVPKVTDIEFRPVTNHLGQTTSGIHGIAEVRFAGTAVVIPEPSTFGLVAISLIALLGFRRRMK